MSEQRFLWGLKAASDLSGRETGEESHSAA